MHDWVLANENMAKVLAAKGYHYQFIFARNAGHTDRTVKQQTLPEALEYLRRGYPDRRADELIFVGRVPDVPDLPDRQHMFNGVPVNKMHFGVYFGSIRIKRLNWSQVDKIFLKLLESTR
jgi:hypothetical protein